jgi:hypothetical protein
MGAIAPQGPFPESARKAAVAELISILKIVKLQVCII